MKSRLFTAGLALGLWGWGLGLEARAALPVTTNTVVRIDVNRGTNRLGTVDVELFDQDKPESVRNFLLYVRSGAYSNTFLHRCVPGFVVQGGGFAVTNLAATGILTNHFLEVPDFGRLTNEFGVGPRLTNSYGTIAMAKLGNDPNSATSEWFFNLNDNGANLDNQNGGFTVFGRVLPGTNSVDGTNVLNHFNTLAAGAGVVNVTTVPVFSDLPVSYTNSTAAPRDNELYATRLYVLGETNAPTTNAPVVAITSPAPNARFTNQTVTVTGTASDDRAVARVVYRHQGAAAEIAAGTNSWQFSVQPVPGFNTVAVESIDWDGHRSAGVTQTFFYAKLLPLGLQVVGPGRVQGVTNGQLVQVGLPYAALAKPNKGYYFDAWSGATTSTAPAVAFLIGTNATNATLTARFLPDFFPILAGSYQGLLQETNTATVPGLENTGFITLSLSKQGSFSGRLRHRGGGYSFIGRFDRTGATFLQGTVGGISRTITLRLNTTNSVGIILGSVSGSSSSSVEAALDRVATGLPTNAPPAGDYPFSIAPPAGTSGPLVPGGHGYGRATVAPKGTLKIKGTFGDGAPFVATAKASRSGRWPIYLSFAKNQGAAQGWFAPATNNVSIIGSRLTWARAFDVKAATYPAGFSNHVQLAGQRLTPPSAGRRYLNWVTGVARIEGANLVVGFTNAVRLETNNTLNVSAPNPANLRLSLDLGTGVVEGSFVHPWLGTTNDLHGTLYKPGESIRGQFRDGNQTGSLLVNIAPFLSTQVLASVTLPIFTAALSEGGLIRFDADGDLTLPDTFTLEHDTALDANGHTIRLSGGGSHRLFIVPADQRFSAIGVTFADGFFQGTNGASGSSPQPGGEACGAGVLNLGGVVGFTNCFFTNFVVRAGHAGSDTGTNVGNRAYPPGGRALGAALCNQGGEVALQDCVLADNLAVAGDGAAWPATNRLGNLPGSALGGAVFSDGPIFTAQGTTFLRSEARGGQPSTWPDGSTTLAGFAAGGAVAAIAGSVRLASNAYQTNIAAAASLGTNSAGAGFAYGGAVFLDRAAQAIIERTVFSGNVATAGSALISTNAPEAIGGAIYAEGTIAVTDSTLEFNSALGGVSSPASPARGGGLAAFGFAAVTNSTLHHNVAIGGAWSRFGPESSPAGPSWGGAIYSVRSNLSVLNCTIAYNQALSGPEQNGVLPGSDLPGDRLGGAIAALSNSTSLASLTLAFNSAGSAPAGGTNAGLAGGGGLVNLGGTIALRASLLVSNTPANHRGSLADVSYNFSSDASAAFTSTTSQSNVNVQLGPLTNNGGTTLTMSLAVNSPARDRIPPGSLPALFDQRGTVRPQPVGGQGDAGAIEAFLTNAAPVFVPPFLTSTNLRAGTNYTLQALAVATNAISYFWQKDGTNIPNANSSTYTLSPVLASDAGNYVLIATNLFGAATSTVATITVDATPQISAHPTNLVISPTANTSFFVGASPTSGMSYYWYHDGVRVGPNAATLPISNAGPADRGAYFVVVSNAYGIATSQVATLSFNFLALNFITQPASITAIEGQTTNLAAVVSAFGNLASFQWYFAGAPIGPAAVVSNATALTNLLTLPNVSSANVGAYSVVVTNAYLSLTSSVAALSLNPAAPPAFTRQPTNLTARAGTNVTFQAYAIGTAPLDYFWLKNGAPISPPATGPSLTLPNVQSTDAASYAAVATNGFGAATSVVAVLTVDSVPRILTNLVDLLVSPGLDTNFSVVADGPALLYVWTHNSQRITNATDATLAITNAGPADRGTYQVVVTNDFGVVVSRLATLRFDSNALAIATQPTNVTVTTGQVATLAVGVTGVPPFAFQWFFGAATLTDETNATLSLPGVDLSHAGNYQVMVTNAYLAVTSVVATLTVDTNAGGGGFRAAAARPPAPAGPGALRLSARIEGGNFLVTCAGPPGTTCRLETMETASRISAASWSAVPQTDRLVPPSGQVSWTLPLPAAGQAVYRAHSP